MENYTYRGKELNYWKVSGDVVATDKFSETHISSSGGGGQSVPMGGILARQRSVQILSQNMIFG